MPLPHFATALFHQRAIAELAARHALRFCARMPFLHQLIDALVDVLLNRHRDVVVSLLPKENRKKFTMAIPPTLPPQPARG